MIYPNLATVIPFAANSSYSSEPKYLNGFSEVVDVLEGIVRENPGALIYLSQWDIRAVEDAIFDNAFRLRSARFFQLLSRGMRWGDPDVAPHISLYSAFCGPGSRGLQNFLHVHLDEVPGLFNGPRWRPKVAVVAISPEDSRGYVTLGPDAGLSYNAVKQSEIRIGIQNMHAPRFARRTVLVGGEYLETGCAFRIEEFDYIVRVWHEYPETEERPLSEGERRMARAVAAITPNGTVLQAGIGNPDSILLPEFYERHEGLRVFAELVGPNAMKLALGQTKGDIYASFVAGSRSFLESLDASTETGERLKILPAEYMVNTSFIVRACGGRLNSLAGALEVDARGNVASATIGTQVFSGVGGAYRYADAAAQTGGESIIVMPATYTRSGKVRSRIVSMLKPGTPHTVSVRTVHRVCTEHGMTDDLHFLTDQERMVQMVGLSAPQFRDETAYYIRQDYGVAVDVSAAAEQVAFERLSKF